MKNNLNLSNLLRLFEKEISKNVKNKQKVFNFEKNKMQNINQIYNVLLSGKYDGGMYNIFLIKEPKHRLVMALGIKDKVINHYIAEYVLEKKLSKYLDPRNIATRKDMGTTYGIKMVKRFLELNKKYNKFYILKIDISKYFYSIDHEILKNMLKGKIDDDEYNFLNSIIDSTNHEYVNRRIKQIKENYLKKHPGFKKEIESLPYYQIGKGLPIGNMTSQFLSIFYLYELDHYIVHNLHIKYYVRYMDDFVLIHHDKEVLKNALKEITDILDKKYKLKINTNKTKIVDSKEGFSFLGYNYRIINKKTITTLRYSSYERMKKRIKQVYHYYKRGDISLEVSFSVIMSYWHNRCFGSVEKTRRAINKYWFNKFNEEE